MGRDLGDVFTALGNNYEKYQDKKHSRNEKKRLEANSDAEKMRLQDKDKEKDLITRKRNLAAWIELYSSRLNYTANPAEKKRIQEKLTELKKDIGKYELELGVPNPKFLEDPTKATGSESGEITREKQTKRFYQILDKVEKGTSPTVEEAIELRSLGHVLAIRDRTNFELGTDTDGFKTITNKDKGLTYRIEGNQSSNPDSVTSKVDAALANNNVNKNVDNTSNSPVNSTNIPTNAPLNKEAPNIQDQLSSENYGGDINNILNGQNEFDPQANVNDIDNALDQPEDDNSNSGIDKQYAKYINTNELAKATTPNEVPEARKSNEVIVSGQRAELESSASVANWAFSALKIVYTLKRNGKWTREGMAKQFVTNQLGSAGYLIDYDLGELNRKGIDNIAKTLRRDLGAQFTLKEFQLIEYARAIRINPDNFQETVDQLLATYELGKYTLPMIADITSAIARARFPVQGIGSGGVYNLAISGKYINEEIIEKDSEPKIKSDFQQLLKSLGISG